MSLKTPAKRALIDFHFNLKNGRKKMREKEEDKQLAIVS